jgi:hypothetical protein
MEDFGIIVACCASDYLFAKGCCASIRYFLGDVPLALLIDGTFPVTDLEKNYGVKVINHNTVSHKALRERSFGWGKTKMVAFWESPWKHFLMLDADTMVWGNLLKYANFQDYDFIVDKPCYTYPDEAVTEYFFDIAGIEQYFPEYPWQKYRDQYFCTGTFFATRDSFTLEEYLEILDFTESHPGIFKYGEMGFLNFMIFRGADTGKLRVGQADMQLLVPDFEQQDLRKRFPMQKEGPVNTDDNATVIHWCGPKPTLSTTKVYADPMSFFRRKCLQDVEGIKGINAEIALQQEDWQRFISVYSRKARKKIAQKTLGAMKKLSKR